MASPAPNDVAGRARWLFLASVSITTVLYLVPYGRQIGYPLMLLSTLAHEMGHGIAAVLIGARFDSFVMWSDGSGAARWSGEAGRFGRAMVAAGGLVGPALAALIGFTLGRGARRARVLLGAVAVGLLLAEVLVVRNIFGWLFVGFVAAALLLLATQSKPWLAQLAVVFLAVQLALSVFSRGDYLFTARAVTANGVFVSDVQLMADALWLPYWMWGALCGALSVAVLLVGLVLLLREGRGSGEAGGGTVAVG